MVADELQKVLKARGATDEVAHQKVTDAFNQIERNAVAAGEVSPDEVELRKDRLANEHQNVASVLMAFSNSLWNQGNLAECEATRRAALAIRERLSGRQHQDTMAALSALADVLRDQGKMTEAETLYHEIVATRRERDGSENPDLAVALANLTLTLLAQAKFPGTEATALECLAIREKQLPDDWRTFNARNLLGGSLLGQKNYAEAEPMLLSSYAGMKQREENIPANARPRLKEALQRLVQLYKATDQPAKAAEWNRQLTEFDHGEAERKTTAPKP